MFVAFLSVLMVAVICAYGTTGLVQRALGRAGNIWVAAAISLACWWSMDCLLSFGLAPLLGPAAQIDLIDMRDLGVDHSLLGKFIQYAVVHTLALVPRTLRRIAPA